MAATHFDAFQELTFDAVVFTAGAATLSAATVKTAADLVTSDPDKPVPAAGDLLWPTLAPAEATRVAIIQANILTNGNIELQAIDPTDATAPIGSGATLDIRIIWFDRT